MRFLALSAEEKLTILNSLSPHATWATLNDRKWCQECDKSISGHSIRVHYGNQGHWLQCGTPGCPGGPLDWHSFPFWSVTARQGRLAQKHIPPASHVDRVIIDRGGEARL